MKKEARSQAALEFLTTYAWAFLALLITMGALYYFGIFDFSKFLPQKCVFPSQFECMDFRFVGNPTNEIGFKLINNIGEPLTVTGLTITNDAEPPLSCTSPATPFAWGEGNENDFTFTNCQNGVFIAGERTEARIGITYCAPGTPGCPSHTFTGKITAIVNLP